MQEVLNNIFPGHISPRSICSHSQIKKALSQALKFGYNTAFFGIPLVVAQDVHLNVTMSPTLKIGECCIVEVLGVPCVVGCDSLA